MPGWRERALTRYTGEKVGIQSLDGDYWIKPCKLGIEEYEAIAAFQATAERNMASDKDLLEEIRRQGPADEKDLEEFEKKIPKILKETKNQLRAVMMFEPAGIHLLKTAILKGIREHNLDDADGKIVEWNKELVDQIVNFDKLALEIFTAVMTYHNNSPLPRGKSGKSKTRQNGSSKAKTSPEVKNTQTEANLTK